MWLTQKHAVHAMDAKQIPLRSKQQCRWITGLFTLCILLLVSTADAERASGEERVEKENPLVYSVCFRSCSRSRWQSTSRHSLESAVHEAGDRRRNREQVFIIKGVLLEELGEYPSHPRYNDKTPVSCLVYKWMYSSRTDIACSLQAMTTEAKDAMLLAKVMRDRGDFIEEVYDFTANGRKGT